jgi:predicted RND superfamily exporter protein
MKAALLRLVRVLIAQAITFGISELAGINVPVINISAGAVLNAIAKFLRDRYKWEWLPV